MIETYQQDCLERLKLMPDNSVDAIVTDPPAGIGFMNEEWDSNKGGRDQWMAWLTEVMKESLRVLKAGGHGLVWAIPRTSHWTAMALENAGFEIRDCVYHINAQGFPKSLNVSKAIDKKYGAEREVIGKKINIGTGKPVGISSIKNCENIGESWQRPCKDNPEWQEKYTNVTAPSTDEAKKYDGYGSQLKPAVECWWLIRKPLEGTIVDNVLKHGTGAINIDKSRIPIGDGEDTTSVIKANKPSTFSADVNNWNTTNLKPQGRFPSNLIHDGSDAVMEEFAKYGESKSSIIKAKVRDSHNSTTFSKNGGTLNNVYLDSGYDDTGSVARFFYNAKASVSERNTALDDFEDKNCAKIVGSLQKYRGKEDYVQPLAKNNHPTVKSVKLMSYLVNLIAPPQPAVILDMFMGTGTTGIAALLNGHDFIGIELHDEYYDIALERLNNYEKFRKYL